MSAVFPASAAVTSSGLGGGSTIDSAALGALLSQASGSGRCLTVIEPRPYLGSLDSCACLLSLDRGECLERPFFVFNGYSILSRRETSLCDQHESHDPRLTAVYVETQNSDSSLLQSLQ